MASSTPASPAVEEDEPVFAYRRLKEDTEMDITPMIDCVFLLLIFFTVTSTPDAQTALELAPAHYGKGVSLRDSFPISIAFVGEKQPAEIYLADGKTGEQVTGTAAEQEARLRAAVEEWIRTGEGNGTVLIKAEKDVLHRDVARVATAVSQVDGVKTLAMAVMEAK